MAQDPNRTDSRSRLHRLRGLIRSLVAIARDPEETAHGARLVMYFDRENTEERYRSFLEEPVGRAIAEGAPSLFDLLTDRASLARLASGSLGRTYLEFMQREDISTEALDEAVAPVEREVHGERGLAFRRFQQHGRASHDLWHVLTGYHRDLLGEAQLIAFSVPQTGSPSFEWLRRLTEFGIGRRVPGGRELIRLADERGRRTRPLLTVDWAPLLSRPIDEVRETLGIGPPPTYTRYVKAPSGRGLVPEGARS